MEESSFLCFFCYRLPVDLQRDRQRSSGVWPFTSLAGCHWPTFPVQNRVSSLSVQRAAITSHYLLSFFSPSRFDLSFSLSLSSRKATEHYNAGITKILLQYKSIIRNVDTINVTCNLVKDSTFFPPRSSSSFFSGYSSRFNPFHSIWRGPTYVRLLTSHVVDPALCVFVPLPVPGITFLRKLNADSRQFLAIHTNTFSTFTRIVLPIFTPNLNIHTIYFSLVGPLRLAVRPSFSLSWLVHLRTEGPGSPGAFVLMIFLSKRRDHHLPYSISSLHWVSLGMIWRRRGVSYP